MQPSDIGTNPPSGTLHEQHPPHEPITMVNRQDIKRMKYQKLLEVCDKVIRGLDQGQVYVIKYWAIARTKSHHGYGIKDDNNYHNLQGHKITHNRCRGGAVHGGYQREGLYLCQKVAFICYIFWSGFLKIKLFVNVFDWNFNMFDS